LSDTTIPENDAGEVHEVIKVFNPNKEKLRMRIKLNYSRNNSAISEDIELNTFPEQCYN
jgi:hypothetical protein